MGRKPDLTQEQAEEIRQFYFDRKAKWTVAALARSYRVEPSTIHAVLNHKGAYARKSPSKPGGG